MGGTIQHVTAVETPFRSLVDWIHKRPVTAQTGQILDSLVAQFDDTTPVLAPGSKYATVHNEIYRFRKCDYAYYVFATITGQEMEEFGTARNPSTPERRDQRIQELKQWWAEHRQEF